MPWVPFQTEMSNGHYHYARVANPEDKPLKDLRDTEGTRIVADDVHYNRVAATVEMRFTQSVRGEAAL